MFGILVILNLLGMVWVKPLGKSTHLVECMATAVTVLFQNVLEQNGTAVATGIFR